MARRTKFMPMEIVEALAPQEFLTDPLEISEAERAIEEHFEADWKEPFQLSFGKISELFQPTEEEYASLDPVDQESEKGAQ